jgi:hypothetical protein
MSEKEDLALNAVEAAAVGAKHRLKEAKVPEVAGFTWNPDKIKWVQAEGSSGPYERSEDVDNPDFKAMLKDLAEHQGKFQREGYFYWAFQKAAVVGRKKRVQ